MGTNIQMATNTTTVASIRSYSLLIRILVTIRILVSYSYIGILFVFIDSK